MSREPIIPAVTKKKIKKFKMVRDWAFCPFPLFFIFHMLSKHLYSMSYRYSNRTGMTSTVVGGKMPVSEGLFDKW